MKKSKTFKCAHGMILALGIILAFNSSAYSQEVDDATKAQVKEVVQEHLSEKTKFSGSLDLYDSETDKVRNLKLLTLIAESITGADGQYEMNGDFRDLTSGDIVDLKVTVADADGNFEVKEIAIFGVKKKAVKKDKEALNKKFTDQEAQDAMKEYIEKMSKFGGTYGLFDQKNEKYRQLKMIKMDSKVRNFGILYISTVEFEDVDSNEKVVVDMTVFNKDGKLEIKSVRIKKITK